MLIDALQIQLFERSLSVLLIGMNGEILLLSRESLVGQRQQFNLHYKAATFDETGTVV